MEKHNRSIPSHKSGEIQIKQHEIHALTIETNHGNILIRAVQPCLLLALVGCKPKSSTSAHERFTSEARGDQRYPARSSSPPPVIDFSTCGLHDEEDLPRLTPVSTRASSTFRAKISRSNSSERQAKISPAVDEAIDLDGDLEQNLEQESQAQYADLLYLQRDKLDELADWLAARLEEKDFRMKEDGA